MSTVWPKRHNVSDIVLLPTIPAEFEEAVFWFSQVGRFRIPHIDAVALTVYPLNLTVENDE